LELNKIHALNEEEIPCSISNCLKCKDRYTCEQCKKFYHLQPSSDFFSKNKCVRCSLDSESCKYDPNLDSNKILKCLDSRKIPNRKINKCFKLNTNCQKYHYNSNHCLQCKKNYYMQSENSLKKCKLCPMNCQMCASFVGCMKCKDGFFVSTSSNGTQECLPCPQNCLRCVTDIFCLECRPSYFKIKNGKEITFKISLFK
jgi:hypothetical protein